MAGKTVVQLYLEFPSVAQQPVPILKGFRKTGNLLPGADVTLNFTLHSKDFSYYHSGGWRAVMAGRVHVGESSADIRLSTPVTFSTEAHVPEAVTFATAPEAVTFGA